MEETIDERSVRCRTGYGASCRLSGGGQTWLSEAMTEGYLKGDQIKGGHFEGEKLRGRVVPGGADWNMGVGGHGGYRKLQNRIRKIFASDR